MTIVRRNALGLSFELSHTDNPNVCEIKLGEKVILVSATLGELSESFYHWMRGAMVQEAFRYLDASQREFLMTGITKEEWDKLFMEEEK